MNGVLSGFPAGILGNQDDPMMNPQTMAMLQAGLGLMSAGGPSRMPVSMGQAFGQAGQAGLQGYAQAQQAQKANVLTNLQMLQLKKELEKADMLKGLFAQAQPTPLPQQALAQGAAQGDIGPTTTNAARLTALEGNPTAATYTPVPLDRLAAAAGAGVDINPFLKLNEETRPDVLTVDLGDKIRLIDKKTMRTLEERPKGAAPASVPYEAQDIPPSAYRDFQLGKANAGATRIQNSVNAFTPASETAQAEFMKGMRTSYDTLKTADTVLDNIDKAKALIPSAKGFMGPGGETLLEAAKFLNNRLGMSINTDGVKDAEELRSRVFFQIMENLKKMDAQPSQMQQIMMRDALGKLGTDPSALGSVLDAYGDVVRGKVDQHNAEVKSATERGVKFPYDPMIKVRGKNAPVEPKASSQTFDSLPPAVKFKNKTIRDTASGKLMRSDGMSWQEVKQ